MKIIDTHAHLDHVENVEKALEAAAKVGVESVLAVGVDLDSNRKNVDIRQRVSNPRIYLGLGIHPGNIKTEEIEEGLEFIRANIDQAVAIGEVGLDFWYRWVRKNDEKKAEQKDVLRRQLEIAGEYDLPAVIHSRGAWKYCFEITQEIGLKKAVFHWYSGPIDILDKILESGYYVSCTPSLAYSKEARAAMEHAPVERTLIETDCPVYFKPGEGEEGFKSEPKDVFRTLDIYSKLKGIEKQQALDILNANAGDLFGI